MKYIHGLVNLPLILEADNKVVIKFWIDVDFTVHHDMKRHTGEKITTVKV